VSEKIPAKRAKSDQAKAKKPVPAVQARKHAGGMPAFVPREDERRQVEALSGYGIPQEQIAALVRNGISADTLAKYFSRELVTGRAKANAGVGRTLHQKAMSGDTQAMIWWSKAQMRWAETQKHEITGRDGKPVQIQALDMTRLSDSALAEILAAKDATEGEQ